MLHYTQPFQRSVHQPALGVGALGALLFAAFPPVGIPLLIIGYLMQRDYTKARKRQVTAAQRQAAQRAEQVRILAFKSLR